MMSSVRARDTRITTYMYVSQLSEHEAGLQVARVYRDDRDRRSLAMSLSQGAVKTLPERYLCLPVVSTSKVEDSS